LAATKLKIYGEAVGITWPRQNEPPRLASLAPVMREIRLSGQVEWRYRRCDDRSDSESLTQ
jgi:hypothetical protein